MTYHSRRLREAITLINEFAWEIENLYRSLNAEGKISKVRRIIVGSSAIITFRKTRSFTKMFKRSFIVLLILVGASTLLTDCLELITSSTDPEELFDKDSE